MNYLNHKKVRHSSRRFGIGNPLGDRFRTSRNDRQRQKGRLYKQTLFSRM